MKKNLFKSVFAVIIGITGALLLTLNIWGSEWYKVAISTLCGVIIGIFIADPKSSLSIFVSIGRETWEMTKKFGFFVSTISERIEAYRLSNEDPWLRDMVGEEKKHWQKIYRRRKIAIPFYFFLRALPLCAFVVAFMAMIVTNTFYHRGIIDTFSYLGGSLIMAAAVTFTFSFHGWDTFIGTKRFQKLFSAFPELKKYVVDFWKWDSYKGKDAIEDMTKFMNIVQVIFFIIFLDLYSLASAIVILLRKIIVGIGIAILAIINFSIVAVPLLLILLMKKIADNGFLLLISSSIVVGALVGTFMRSYVDGVAVGLAFMILSFSSSVLLKNVSPFYLFEKGTFIHKMSKYTF